jgi:FlaA1/EpsC-like NDP-sugar epimerase
MNGSDSGMYRSVDDSNEAAPQPIHTRSALAAAEARLREELNERQPPSQSLRLKLGLCLAAQKREKEASRELGRAAEGEDPELAARALLQMIRLDGTGAGVVGLLQRAEKLASATKHPTIAVDVATALVKFGDRAHAVRLLERVREEAPAPAPRGHEDPGHRRARVLAALLLAQLRQDDPAAVTDVDDLLQDVVDANDPGLSPVAALTLAKRQVARPAPGCVPDELLRIAWRFDHPSASPEAAMLLVKLYEQRGQKAWALDLLDALTDRGDAKAIEWAKARRRHLRGKEGEDLTDAPPPADPVPSASPRRRPVRTIVIGHGTAARRLLHELDPDTHEIAGLIDDYTGAPIGSHQVLGGIDDLPRVFEEDRRIIEVWLAIPAAGPQLRFRIGTACAEARVRLQVVRNPYELLPDKNYIGQLRDLRVEETYGEPDERIAVDRITGDAVRGRSVLIVGGAGSIGSELARQVIRGRPRHLALVDHNEAGLDELDWELREDRRFKWTFTSIVDAAHRGEVKAAMEDHKPDVVFLAHGLNHAHQAQGSIVHAARVNVLSNWIAAEQALLAGAKLVVLVSSDNAAHLHGPFDWTKAVAERAVVGLRSEDGGYACAVRLPNVFRTSGSVIERFDRQITARGPVTVTDERARRRYLNVHQAAQWLLRIAAMAEGGAVYAVDAGVEVRIRELAERLIRLRGFEPGRHMQIIFPGPRPGEKGDAQDLWGRDERILNTAIDKVVRVVGSELDMERALPELRNAERMVDPSPADVHAMLQRALGLAYPPDQAGSGASGRKERPHPAPIAQADTAGVRVS